MARFRFFLLSLFLMIFSSLSAQTTVKGVLVDSLNKDKLFYVSVGIVTPDTLMRVVGAAFTEADGSFTITDVPAGSYLLKASLVGYDMLTRPVTVPQGKATLDLGTIGMKKMSNALEGVSVTATKPVYMMDGEKTLYNVSEDPSVQTGTASDALQNAPGVEVDVEGNITLRGVSSVEIWINDKPSHLNEEGLKTFIQQLPANTLERIEVITNGTVQRQRDWRHHQHHHHVQDQEEQLREFWRARLVKARRKSVGLVCVEQRQVVAQLLPQHPLLAPEDEHDVEKPPFQREDGYLLGGVGPWHAAQSFCFGRFLLQRQL